MPYRDRDVRLAYNREYHRKRRESGESLSYHQQRRAKLRALVLEARNKPCVDCGVPADHLHHVDPATKKFNLGEATRGRPPAGTVKGVLAEIAKCVPLCSACHGKRHRKGSDES